MAGSLQRRSSMSGSKQRGAGGVEPGGEADGSTGGLGNEGASKQEGGGAGAADAVHKELAAKSSANISQTSSVYSPVVRVTAFFFQEKKREKYTSTDG
jgi:hypothetical protein